MWVEAPVEPQHDGTEQLLIRSALQDGVDVEIDRLLAQDGQTVRRGTRHEVDVGGVGEAMTTPSRSFTAKTSAGSSTARAPVRSASSRAPSTNGSAIITRSMSGCAAMLLAWT